MSRADEIRAQIALLSKELREIENPPKYVEIDGQQYRFVGRGYGGLLLKPVGKSGVQSDPPSSGDTSAHAAAPEAAEC